MFDFFFVWLCVCIFLSIIQINLYIFIYLIEWFQVEFNLIYCIWKWCNVDHQPVRNLEFFQIDVTFQMHDLCLATVGIFLQVWLVKDDNYFYFIPISMVAIWIGAFLNILNNFQSFLSTLICIMLNKYSPTLIIIFFLCLEMFFPTYHMA